MEKQQSILEQIRANPKFDQKNSQAWFNQKIKELGSKAPISRVTLLKTTQDIQTPRMMIGTMCFFGYDPKHKDTLPHYDRFPLSFVFGLDSKGFIGINFHYLNIPMRVRLYDAMWKIASQSHLPTQQVKAITWQLLSNVSRFPGVGPAVKRYLYGHVRTKFIKVDIQDWKTAIMLPVSQFTGANEQSIQRLSKISAAAALRKK